MLEITTNPLLHRIYFFTIIQICLQILVSQGVGAQKKSQAKHAILKQVKENSKVTKNTSFAECYVHLFSINMNGINDFEL